MTNFYVGRSVSGNALVEAGSSSLQRRLFRHFGTHTERRNLYRLTTGVYTELQPDDWSDIDRVFYGSHYEPLTDTEVTRITDAGFGDYIVTD
jgi:hypothetical protein